MSATVGERLARVLRQVHVLEAAAVGAQSSDVELGAHLHAFEGVTQEVMREVAAELYWLQLGLEHDGLLATPAPTDDEREQRISAPLAGTFLAEVAGTKLATVGGTVKRGEPLCLIEHGGTVSEILSEHAGEVLAIHVEHGSQVQRGQLMFSIAKA